MNRKVAEVLRKAEMAPEESLTLKRRHAVVEANKNGVRLASLSKPIPETHVQNTDYTPMPNIATMPLKLRERSRFTEWPVRQRPVPPSALPESRDVGKLFRRYNNGTLAYDDIVPKIKAIVQSYNDGFPLDETEAIMLASVFPEIRFRNIPDEMVDIKAPLTDRERNKIRRRLPICPTGC